MVGVMNGQAFGYLIGASFDDLQIPNCYDGCDVSADARRRIFQSKHSQLVVLGAIHITLFTTHRTPPCRLSSRNPSHVTEATNCARRVKPQFPRNHTSAKLCTSICPFGLTFVSYSCSSLLPDS